MSACKRRREAFAASFIYAAFQHFLRPLRLPGYAAGSAFPGIPNASMDFRDLNASAIDPVPEVWYDEFRRQTAAAMERREEWRMPCMKKLLWLLLPAALLVCSACGPASQTSQDADTPIQDAGMGVPEEASSQEGSLDALRQEIADDGALCAAAYLGGWVGGLSDGDLRDRVLDLLDGDGSWTFLEDLPRESFVDCQGDDIYCVIPRADTALTVTEWVFDFSTDDWEGAPGQELYSAQAGEPLVVRGNVSDLMPNFQITAQTEGETLPFFLTLSLYDGSLEVPEEGVLDWTVYEPRTE